MEDTIKLYEEERPWGKFRKFTDNSVSTVKIIYVNPLKRLSLQSHNKRQEFWKVISGSGVFDVRGEAHDVKTGDEIVVQRGDKHRIIGGEDGMSVLEISTGEFDENDIVRYEDDFGRI